MGCLLVAETTSQEVTLVDHTNKATPLGDKFRFSRAKSQALAIDRGFRRRSDVFNRTTVSFARAYLSESDAFFGL